MSETLGALIALGLISSTVKMVANIELRSYGNGGGKNKELNLPLKKEAVA